MLIKPVEGIKMRDPRTMRHIPEEGIEVLGHELWVQRGITQGDLIDADAADAERKRVDAAAEAKAKAETDLANASAEMDAAHAQFHPTEERT